MVRIIAELSPAHAALVKHALAHLSAPDPTHACSPNPPETPTPETGTPEPATPEPPATTPATAATAQPEHPSSATASKRTDDEEPGEPTTSEREDAGDAGPAPAGGPGTTGGPTADDGAGTTGGPTTGDGTTGDGTGTTGGPTAGDGAGTGDSAGAGSAATAAADPPGSGGGLPQRDPRPPDKRRADALMELITRATACLPGGDPGSVTSHPKAVIILDHDTLTGGLRPFSAPPPGQPPGPPPKAPPGDTGRPEPDPTRFTSRYLPGTGTTLYGDLLNPATLRQIACDAGIIPAVLGTNGAPLDLGREKRLFTGGLRTAIVLRDQHCTFPSCDRPPDWCQAHHLIPWWLGGPTTLTNATLLCERHHTIAHRDDLLALHTHGTIHWNTTPGSLTRHLNHPHITGFEDYPHAS